MPYWPDEFNMHQGETHPCRCWLHWSTRRDLFTMPCVHFLSSFLVRSKVVCYLVIDFFYLCITFTLSWHIFKVNRTKLWTLTERVRLYLSMSDLQNGLLIVIQFKQLSCEMEWTRGSLVRALSLRRHTWGWTGITDVSSR